MNQGAVINGTVWNSVSKGSGTIPTVLRERDWDTKTLYHPGQCGGNQQNFQESKYWELILKNVWQGNVEN